MSALARLQAVLGDEAGGGQRPNQQAAKTDKTNLPVGETFDGATDGGVLSVLSVPISRSSQNHGPSGCHFCGSPVYGRAVDLGNGREAHTVCHGRATAERIMASAARRQRPGILSEISEPIGGVLLDDAGLPHLPCAICVGTNFWTPADGPAEFGLWECCLCNPAPLGLLCHACAVP